MKYLRAFLMGVLLAVMVWSAAAGVVAVYAQWCDMIENYVRTLPDPGYPPVR